MAYFVVMNCSLPCKQDRLTILTKVSHLSKLVIALQAVYRLFRQPPIGRGFFPLS